MTVTRNILLLVIAIVLFLIAAALSAGWFGTHANPGDVGALGFFGLAFFAGAHVP